MKSQSRALPCPMSRCFLRIALPLILLSAVTLLIDYLSARAVNTLAANHYYPALLEYIIASLALSAAGSLVIDIVQKDFEK